MKFFNILVVFFLVLISPLSYAGTEDIKVISSSPITIGESTHLFSKNLNENITINVYLPPSYSVENKKNYPIIYLLDGGVNDLFLHIVGLIQFDSINRFQDTIVVGIQNSDRFRDFTYPSHNTEEIKDYPTSGKSKNFINFIEKELQPYINTHYAKSRSNTIIGHSLGGLLATQILMEKPDLFDNYLLLSPSLWWDKEALLKSKLPKYTTQKKVFIAVGSEEKDFMKSYAYQLKYQLESHDREHLMVTTKQLSGLHHGTIPHIGTYFGLEYIFSNRKIF